MGSEGKESGVRGQGSGDRSQGTGVREEWRKVRHWNAGWRISGGRWVFRSGRQVLGWRRFGHRFGRLGRRAIEQPDTVEDDAPMRGDAEDFFAIAGQLARVPARRRRTQPIALVGIRQVQALICSPHKRDPHRVHILASVDFQTADDIALLPRTGTRT